MLYSMRQLLAGYLAEEEKTTKPITPKVSPYSDFDRCPDQSRQPSSPEQTETKSLRAHTPAPFDTQMHDSNPIRYKEKNIAEERRTEDA